MAVCLRGNFKVDYIEVYQRQFRVVRGELDIYLEDNVGLIRAANIQSCFMGQQMEVQRDLKEVLRLLNLQVKRLVPQVLQQPELAQDQLDLGQIDKLSQMNGFLFSQMLESVDNQLDQIGCFNPKRLNDNFQDFLQFLQSDFFKKFQVNLKEFHVINIKPYQIISPQDQQNINQDPSYMIINIENNYKGIPFKSIRTIFLEPTQERIHLYEQLVQVHGYIIDQLMKERNYERMKNDLKIFLEQLIFEKSDFFQWPFLFKFEENSNNLVPITQGEIPREIPLYLHMELREVKLTSNQTQSFILGDSLLLQKENRFYSANLALGLPEVEFYHPNGVPILDLINPEYDPGNVKRHRRLFEAVKKTEMINEAQLELLYTKMEELEVRIWSGNFNTEKPIDKRIRLEAIVSYATKQQQVKNSSDQIWLDTTYKCLLLPINKRIVPFNISCIKNLTLQNNQNRFLLWVNFQTPVIQTGNLIFPDPKIFGKIPIYIKELSFIVGDEIPNRILALIEDFRKLQKQVNLQESLKHENIFYGNFRELGSKMETLGGVQIRPSLEGRKTIGTLEIYLEGLRFVFDKSKFFNLNICNVTDCIFQPADDDLIVIIHLQLNQPMLINEKLTQCVQFVMEVGYTSEDLSDPKRLISKDEMLEEEQVENAKRNYNKLFQGLVYYLQEKFGEQVNFDNPFKSTRFLGSHHNNMTSIYFTRNSLVSLIEKPFLVIFYTDIEVVVVERADGETKGIDLVIVFKDYTKPVQFIRAIPAHYLDMLKILFTQHQIVFLQGINAGINWQKFLENAVSDPITFVQKDQGWFAFSELSDDSSDEDVNEDDLIEKESIEDDMEVKSSDNEFMSKGTSSGISGNDSFDSERISKQIAEKIKKSNINRKMERKHYRQRN